MSKLAELAKSEPVRLYLYSVVIPLLALLVGFGVVDANQTALILGLAGAVLAIPAVEVARSKVTPYTLK